MLDGAEEVLDEMEHGGRAPPPPGDLTFCSHSLVSLFPGMRQVLHRCLKVLPPLGESSTDEFVYSTLLS